MYLVLGVQVRNLRWLDFRVPLLLVNKANQANQLYPHAVSLMESVRTYDFTCERIAAQPSIAPLVSAAKSDCQTAILEVRFGSWLCPEECVCILHIAQPQSQCIYGIQQWYRPGTL